MDLWFWYSNWSKDYRNFNFFQELSNIEAEIVSKLNSSEIEVDAVDYTNCLGQKFSKKRAKIEM